MNSPHSRVAGRVRPQERDEGRSWAFCRFFFQKGKEVGWRDTGDKKRRRRSRKKENKRGTREEEKERERGHCATPFLAFSHTHFLSSPCSALPPPRPVSTKSSRTPVGSPAQMANLHNKQDVEEQGGSRSPQQGAQVRPLRRHRKAVEVQKQLALCHPTAHAVARLVRCAVRRQQAAQGTTRRVREREVEVALALVVGQHPADRRRDPLAECACRVVEGRDDVVEGRCVVDDVRHHRAEEVRQRVCVVELDEVVRDVAGEDHEAGVQRPQHVDQRHQQLRQEEGRHDGCQRHPEELHERAQRKVHVREVEEGAGREAGGPEQHVAPDQRGDEDHGHLGDRLRHRVHPARVRSAHHLSVEALPALEDGHHRRHRVDEPHVPADVDQRHVVADLARLPADLPVRRAEQDADRQREQQLGHDVRRAAQLDPTRPHKHRPEHLADTLLLLHAPPLLATLLLLLPSDRHGETRPVQDGAPTSDRVRHSVRDSLRLCGCRPHRRPVQRRRRGHRRRVLRCVLRRLGGRHGRGRQQPAAPLSPCASGRRRSRVDDGHDDVCRVAQLLAAGRNVLEVACNLTLQQLGALREPGRRRRRRAGKLFQPLREVRGEVPQHL
eukprot:Rhum_TRINITY_DN14721_c16_g1::Rhum_TRINITY_DN14721_c16_g1_i1::g.112733::m.112733